ncbi:MAG TPA: hypothetical protein ENG80_05465 [Nitrospirae bacterium]|nr:hypothetical protein [Nitrospirota bacterium]
MNRTDEKSVLFAILNDAYAKIFFKNWPVWLGGLLIGITSVITFAWARPWGVIGGLREWFDWLFYSLGIYSTHPYYSPHLSSASVLTFGLLWGAFASGLLSKQFAVRTPPPFELVRSAIGGTLMGIGAAMAMGCNVGGFFSAASALTSLMGKEVFLPSYISYHWSVILIVGIMLAYYVITSWNEKTGAFI